MNMRTVILILLSAFGLSRASTISITVTPDSEFTHKLIGMTMTPQMALWVEDTSGTFIATIYVTKFSWGTFGKLTPARPDALPVWRWKGVGRGIKDANADATSSATVRPDASTGATPKQQFTKEWIIPDSLKGRALSIYAEANNSFDYNDTYKKKLPKDDPHYNSANGQPSLVYRGVISTASPQLASMSLIGHGDIQGRSGAIDTRIESITTARKIVKSISIQVKD